VLLRHIRHDEATPWRPDGTCGIGMPPSTKTLWRPYGGTERARPACSHCKYLKLTGTRRKARARETWKLAVRTERPVPAPLSNLHFRTLPSKKFRVGHKNCKGLYVGTVSELFFRNTESASGRVSGAELPGRFQVSLPRAVMLNESVEDASRSGRLIRVRSKALRRSLAS
jgi:hypothetical protein